MSHDLTRKYFVKIKTLENEGTGIIFKADRKGLVFYILTARHIFFPSTSSEEKVSPKILKKDEIYIYLETNSEENIIKDSIVIYSLKNPAIDIAVIIIKKECTNIENDLSVHYLEVFDMDDNPFDKLEFFLSGYPEFTSKIDRSSKLISYNLKHAQFENDDNIIARLYCTSSPILSPSRKKPIEEMKGISGAGVFVKENNNSVNLSHIQHNAPAINFLLATRVDLFLDEINAIILAENKNFPLIKTSTKVMIEDMNIEDFGNFSFLKEKINKEIQNHREVINEKYPQLVEIKNETLKEIHKNINELSKSLSYLYAYRAIKAHDEGKRRLTTLCFKKAIELNPEHRNTFIQEKAVRTNNIEKIEEMSSYFLDDSIKFHDKIIKDYEDNDPIKIEKIKNAINAIIRFEESDNQKNKLQEYFEFLEKSYKENKILRAPYKYKDLGEFYIHILQNERAIKALYTSQFIFEESPQTEKNTLTLQEVKNIIKTLKENIIENDNIKNEAFILAKETMEEEEEDQNIKEQLKKSNAMISVIYDDIYHIKQEENKRKETILNLDKTLSFLKAKVELQINQNESHNLDTLLINESITKLDIFNTALDEKIKSIPEKYQISIDEQTKYDILDTIQSPLDDFSNKIDNATEKVTQTTDAVNEIINHAEKQLSFIKQEGIKDLEAIKSDVQKRLTAFEQQEVQISAYKNEVLDYLKASEHRMLERIEQLYLNDTAKNEAIQVVQDSISQLEKTLLNTFASESKIQNYNNFSINKKIETVLNACRNLESTVITQTNDILSYSKDIDLVKNQQNALEDSLIPQTAQALAGLTQNQELLTHIRTNQYRLEHSLLTHTQHALNNYQNIINHQTIKPPLSKSKKIFLAVYFIVMFASALYFIIRYGLLDLLLNLWHTAWQQLNG